MPSPPGRSNHDTSSGPCSVCRGHHDVLIDGRCVTHWVDAMDEAEGRIHRYFLKLGDGDWEEVTLEAWVAAERKAGFVNTLGFDDRPGTGGFSTTRHGGMRGRIDSETPCAYCKANPREVGLPCCDNGLCKDKYLAERAER